MAVFDTSDGAPPIGQEPLPLSPIQSLRVKIGILADCQTRMLDELARADDTAGFNVAYLRKQLVHMGPAFEEACAIVQAMDMLSQAAAPDFLDGFTEVEIVHLGTGRLHVEPKGGDA